MFFLSPNSFQVLLTFLPTQSHVLTPSQKNKQSKTTNKPRNAKVKLKAQRIKTHGARSVLTNSSWTRGLPWIMVALASHTALEKTDFPLPVGINCK